MQTTLSMKVVVGMNVVGGIVGMNVVGGIVGSIYGL